MTLFGTLYAAICQQILLISSNYIVLTPNPRIKEAVDRPPRHAATVYASRNTNTPQMWAHGAPIIRGYQKYIRIR